MMPKLAVFYHVFPCEPHASDQDAASSRNRAAKRYKGQGKR